LLPAHSSLPWSNDPIAATLQEPENHSNYQEFSTR